MFNTLPIEMRSMNCALSPDSSDLRTGLTSGTNPLDLKNMIESMRLNYHDVHDVYNIECKSQASDEVASALFEVLNTCISCRYAIKV